MPNPVRLNIASRSGRVVVRAEEGAELRTSGATVEQEAEGSFVLKGAKAGSGAIEVRCPAGSELVIATASGRIEVHGRAGDTRISTRSGKIELDHVGALDVRAASGRISVRACDGDCKVLSRSGSIEIGRARSVEIAGTSGKIVVGATGDANVRTMSGHVEVGTDAHGNVEVRTISGRVNVTVPKERRPATTLKSLSGRVRSDCDIGDDGVIDVSTTSGTISVTCK